MKQSPHKFNMLVNKLASVNKKHRILLPMVAITGLFTAVLIVKLQPGVDHQSQLQIAVPVSTIVAKSRRIRPSITGFGTVAADTKLELKAEISGRILYVNPELKKGALLAKDTIVIKIDDVDYQLALKQAQADLLVNKANLTEFDLTIANTKQDLILAAQKLKLSNKEYQRKAKLKKQGTVSQSTVDAEYKQVLSYKQENQNLQNKISAFPSQKSVLAAKVAISEAKVEQHQRNLARTTIKLPFGGRIGDVSVEQDQYITAASPLFNEQGIEKIIINAQFSIDDFYIIAKSFQKSPQILQQAIANKKISTLFQQLGVTATVFSTNKVNAQWPAKVERISDSIDPQSRTLGVMVSVSDSYKTLTPGVKPPLMEGMYMQVQLSASADNYVVVPRFALHQQQLYVVDKENKLERIKIKNPQLQGELVLLNEQTLAGKQVVVSDLFPAVNGMLLAPQSAISIAKELEKQIAGE